MGAISKNPVQQDKTKHIAIRLRYVRDLLLDGALDLEYCPTNRMNADLPTKALGKMKTAYFRNLLAGTV